MDAPPPAAADRIDPRRLVAFMAMCFGMFMALLDIQIVSASLNEIQAGLAASGDEIPWVQTAYLIAEVVAIPLSGFLSRALGTRMLFAVSCARLHLRELHVRTELVDRHHDRLARGAGLHRRRHDPHRVRRRLHDLSEVAPSHGDAADRPDRDARAHDRPDRRRLSHRRAVLALAVLHQRRSRRRSSPLRRWR